MIADFIRARLACVNRRRSTLRGVVLVVVAAFCWLVYENSSGKEVFSAILTFLAVVVGTYLARDIRPSLAAVVKAGVVLGIAVIGVLLSTPGVDRTYSLGTTFLTETLTGRPAFIRLMPFQGEVEGIAGVLGTDKWNADNAGGALVYHHLLQRAILQYLVSQQSRRAGKMNTSFCGWEPEIWQDRRASISVIAGEAIKQTFANNLFISAEFFPAAELVVPKGARLFGVVPSLTPGHDIGVIQLKNSYFDLRIETAFRASMRGIQGNYARLTTGGADRQDDRYSSLTYGIRVAGQGRLLNRLFPFHNDTVTYVEWIQQITKQLSCVFDERERWKVMVDELSFRHAIGARK